MHPTQEVLLSRLLSKNYQKYSSLTAGYDFEDNIVFHLKQLTRNNLVKKQGELYTLTAEGIIAAKKDGAGLKMFFVGFVCENNDNFLVREHLAGKINFYNLPSGKPKFGEEIDRALVRIFFENTGLKLKPKDFVYQSLHLKTVKTSRGQVLFDDAFSVYRVKITIEQRTEMKPGKEIKWLTAEETKELPNRWPEIDLCIIKKDKRPFLSYQFTSDHILV